MKRKIIKYDDFVKKFQPKKTTDDCYTPEAVYDVVLDWVERNAVVEFGDVVPRFTLNRITRGRSIRKGAR